MEFSHACAITGGIASGKSAACAILRELGFDIIDADKIAHEVLDSSAHEVVCAFGEEILGANCKIERKKLGAIVFNDKAKLARLEAILHPKIRAEVLKKAQDLEARILDSRLDSRDLDSRFGLDSMDSRLDSRESQTPKTLYFVDIPLFFEVQARGFGYEINRVLLIYAPKEAQLARLMKRDNLDARAANARIAAQIDIEKKREMANYIIENTGDLGDLRAKILAFLENFARHA